MKKEHCEGGREEVKVGRRSAMRWSGGGGARGGGGGGALQEDDVMYLG